MSLFVASYSRTLVSLCVNCSDVVVYELLQYCVKILKGICYFIKYLAC